MILGPRTILGLSLLTLTLVAGTASAVDRTAPQVGRRVMDRVDPLSAPRK